jgi:hypothetical protein
MINIERESANVTRVYTSKATYVFSYDTCVAVFCKCEQTDIHQYHWVISENLWSTTTGKLLNQLEPDKAKRLPRREFEKILEELDK